MHFSSVHSPSPRRSAAVALVAVLYGMQAGSCPREAPPPPASLGAAVAGEASPRAVPAVAIRRTRRAERYRSRSFKGRYVLLNLWATWCAPCVKELPALADLQGAWPTGSSRSSPSMWPRHAGRCAPPSSRRTTHGADTYIDPDLALLRAFGAYGLPLTILIDARAARSRAPSDPPTGAPESIDYFKALTARS